MTLPTLPVEPTAPTQAETPKSQETPSPAVQPADAPVEEWDKERAAATIKAQREESKALKAQLKELDQFKQEKQQRAEAEMTEAQKLQAQADKLTAENAALKAELLRREVIAETGLPSILADRLRGVTKEEMLADAANLLDVMPKTKINPAIGPTNPSNGKQTESDEQKRERLFGKQGNPMEYDEILRQGGGVYWPNK